METQFRRGGGMERGYLACGYVVLGGKRVLGRYASIR